MPAARCGSVRPYGEAVCALPAGHPGLHSAGHSHWVGAATLPTPAEAFADSLRLDARYAPATKDENETKDETPREQWRYVGRHCSHEGRPCSFMVWRRLEDDGTPTTGTRWGRDWIMRPAYSIVPSLPWNFS